MGAINFDSAANLPPETVWRINDNNARNAQRYTARVRPAERTIFAAAAINRARGTGNYSAIIIIDGRVRRWTEFYSRPSCWVGASAAVLGAPRPFDRLWVEEKQNPVVTSSRFYRAPEISRRIHPKLAVESD